MTTNLDGDRITPIEQSSTRCPQCDQPLDIVDRSTLVGYACHDCGGIWLDSATTTRVEQSLDTQTIQVGEIADAMAAVPFPPHKASPECPLCKSAMRTWTVTGTDVEVDTCDAHGTWFDRGELQSLIRELMARPQPDLGGSATHPISPADLRQQMIDQYGIDPSGPPRDERDAVTSGAAGVATAAAFEIGLTLLGALLSSGDRR